MANPPQAPIKNLAPFQKNMVTPPPVIPAITVERTNIPRSFLLGGLTAGKTPNFKMSTRHTRERV
jgi:hypothetical protein